LAKKKRKARFIKPPNRLRQKVGYGGINPMLLTRGNEYISANKFDFEPFAKNFLETLEGSIKDINSGGLTGKDALDLLSRPVMELKGNGGMFGYALISEIADIVLNFLENIEELNDDAYEILDVHQKTLNIIVSNKLKGDGGAVGKQLARELFEACNRFYKKYDIKPQGVSIT
jgi:hypothetical protein